MRGLVVAMSLFLGATNLFAHGGGLNQCGCHFDRKKNECHCHRESANCGCDCEAASCREKKPSQQKPKKSLSDMGAEVLLP